MLLILLCFKFKDFNIVNGLKVFWLMLFKLLDLRFNCESFIVLMNVFFLMFLIKLLVKLRF